MVRVCGHDWVGGAGLAGGLPGLGSGMGRGPYARWKLGQVLDLTAMCPSALLTLLDAGPRPGWVGKTVEPAGLSHGWPRLNLVARLAAGARPAELGERGGDRSDDSNP
jgi:hypothetical protein